MPRSNVLTSVALAIVLCVTNCSDAFAAGGQTGNIAGVITDATTKLPLSNVTVRAASPSGSYTAHTDARGGFAIIGLSIDTYTIAATLNGYDTFVEQGVTVQGDQTLNVSQIRLARSLKTIGRTSARSASSAYQPTQTIDQTTVSGARAIEAQGKQESTDLRALALSVPGVQLTNGDRLTIRGGLSTEIGYQLDGIDFTEPFLFGNANNDVSSGVGSLQVVEGAGDATQGGIGGGVINTVIKRGTYPHFGLLDLEMGAPYFNHQAGLEYGFASPDNRFSDYISYVGQRFNPAYGLTSTDPALTGNYDGVSYQVSDDVINNFVFRFGHDKSQSLQVLYLNHDLRQYGDLSGVAGRVTNQFNPYNLSQLPQAAGDPIANSAFYSQIYGQMPYAPTTAAAPSGAEQTAYNPTRYLKFEYTNSLNATTFLDLRAFNVNQLQGTSNYYNYYAGSTYDQTGGQRAGAIAELTHAFGSKNTVTAGASIENNHPIWNDYDSFSALYTLGNNYLSAAAYQPSIADYALPPNTRAPLSAANPCPVTGGCYLYSTGNFNGATTIAAPQSGINYNGTDFQQYAVYLRDQFVPNSRLHIDAGLRMDASNWKQGATPFNTQPGALANPDDVPVGIGPPGTPNFLSNAVVHPRFVEPRFAASFELTPNDSVRAGFGQSVTFPNAQGQGTPNYVAGIPGSFFAIAPTPGSNTADPATWTCGTGLNPQWLVGGNPNAANATNGGTGAFFRCRNYAQQVYWDLDQNHDAPDVGNDQPETFSNTDFTYQHLFRNGLSAKVTGYVKRGFNIPAFSLVSQVLNPQGVPISQVFAGDNVGINKTSGVEFSLNTADHPTGLGGYFSATYTNVIDSVPPLVQNEDYLPFIPPASLALGNTYHAGYISPFTLNVGFQYKLRNGIRINPDIRYDRGFPTGVGNIIPSANPLGPGFAGLPQSNLNPPSVYGYTGITGTYNATNYVDPANAGTITNPNVNVTRGTPETSAAGGFLSRPRVHGDVTVEYTKARNTFGIQVLNVFGNPYGEPIPNPYWQPVATGIGGPQTGQTSAALPGTTTYQYGGFRNIPSVIYGQNAYIEPIGVLDGASSPDYSRPLTLRLYYQLAL